MFGTIRRHQNWLWAIIIAVIISFVVFFSPTANLGDRGPSVNFGTIGGRPITQQDIAASRKETALFYFLRFGDWPENQEMMRQFNFDIERETYNRLLLVEQMR